MAIVQFGFAGLYVRLKDKCTQLEDKLQLVRFAWKSRDVFIPNKEQVLIDLLCGYLINKKKNQLSEDSVCKVWQCLSDVLHTKKARIPNKQGQGLVVKQSISQLLTEALVATEESNGCAYISSVIGCCQAIITSPMLSYVFTSRLDLMVTLMGSLCRLLQNSDNGKLVSLLVHHTAEKFIKVQKTAPNQNLVLQWVCDKLLTPFMSLWSLLPSEDAQKMSQVVMATVCHKDHHQSFEVYLMAQHGKAEVKVHKKAKAVEHLFSTFSKLFQVETEAAEHLCQYLSVFLDGYISTNCHNMNLQQFHYMLMELTKLIGLQHDSSALCGTLPAACVVKGVNALLKVVQKYELYNIKLDERNEWNQIKFYKHIVQVLLNNKQLVPDWYSCLTILLQLNHHILETSLIDILSTGWINPGTQITKEAVDSMDGFLQELIITYQKLRQVPKFVTKLLDTLSYCQGNQPINLTPRFLKSYGDVIQSLPQGMTTDVWKMFIQCLKQNFLDRQTGSKQVSGHFQGVCSLFHHYLLNIKVTDYTVTDLTTKAVHDLMVTMETEIMSPLLQTHLKKMNNEHLCSVLHLCHAWGEVMAMLALYTGYRASILQTKGLVSNPADLAFLHSYLTKEEWMTLYEKLRKTKNASLLYVWDVLCVQTVRAVVLFRDNSSWSSVRGHLESLMTFPRQPVAKDVEMTWSGSLFDVTNGNQTVARWHLLTSHMAAIQAAVSDEHLRNMAEFTVQALSLKAVSNHKGELSLYSITEDVLRSPWMRECRSFLSHVVTSVWADCEKCFTSTIPKGKKRRSEAGVSAACRVMSALGDWDISWKQQVNSETLVKIQEASTALTPLLANDGQVSQVTDFIRLQGYIQIMQSLPLEQLWSCDQIRCLIGLLGLREVLDKCGDKSLIQCVEKAPLTLKCMELCTVVLESCGMAPIFQIIDAGAYLEWLQTLPAQFTQDDVNYKKVLLFMEMSCSAMLKDYQVLEKLPIIVDKLCKKIDGMDFLTCPNDGVLQLALFILKESSKMLTRSYLNERAKTSYNSIYLALATTLLKLSSLIKGHVTGEGHMTHKDHMTHADGIVVQCYTAVLSAYFVDDAVKETFYNNFPSVLEWCEGVLREETAEENFLTRMQALNFLYTISRCHILMETVFLADKKLRIWNVLICLLRKLLGQQTQYSKDMTSCQSVQADQLGRKETSSHLQDNSQTNSLDEKKMINNSEENSDNVGREVDVTEGIDSSSKDHLSVSEKIFSPVMIASLYKSLVFDGKLKGQSSKVLLMQVQTVIAALLASFDLEHFGKVIQELVTSVSSSNVLTDRRQIQSSLYVWRHLLRLEFSDEQAKVLRYSARNMMLNFQCVLQQLYHHGNDDVVMEITVPILHTQQQMLALGPKFLPAQTAILCLHSCVYTPLDGSTYIPVFHAVTDVLNTLLNQHSETVFKNIPAYVGCAKRLLLSVVEQSNQEKILQQTTLIKRLIGCAYQMERLFTLISSHKVEFGKVAMYVVSDYVTAVQKVTLLPAIKRGLVPAIYKMLDLCDKHSVAQLHTVLSHGVIEVFKLLYNEYTKFHKYSGKV